MHKSPESDESGAVLEVDVRRLVHEPIECGLFQFLLANHVDPAHVLAGLAPVASAEHLQNRLSVQLFLVTEDHHCRFPREPHVSPCAVFLV